MSKLNLKYLLPGSTVGRLIKICKFTTRRNVCSHHKVYLQEMCITPLCIDGKDLPPMALWANDLNLSLANPLQTSPLNPCKMSSAMVSGYLRHKVIYRTRKIIHTRKVHSTSI